MRLLTVLGLTSGACLVAYLSPLFAVGVVMVGVSMTIFGAMLVYVGKEQGAQVGACIPHRQTLTGSYQDEQHDAYGIAVADWPVRQSVEVTNEQAT